MKSGYLTGSSRKQDMTPLLQKTFSISKPCFHPCLQIFTSHHGTNSFQSFRICYLHLIIFVKDSTKHHTAPCQYFTSQCNKHASRRTVNSIRFIFIFYRPYLLRRNSLIAIQKRTDFLAQTAIYTVICIYPRIKKTFFILIKRYTMLRALLYTSCTTTALPLIYYTYH